jgi:hypothetical protein
MKKLSASNNNNVSKVNKLALKRETIVILSNVQLQQVVGASAAATGCTSGEPVCGTE